MTAAESILDEVLGRWRVAVETHRPREVAELFTEDAIFQGLHPYSVGRQGIVDYYDGQPLGLTPSYRLLETRQPAAGVVLGYADVVFAFADRPAIRVLLSVLLTRHAQNWLISHYQVSAAPDGG